MDKKRILAQIQTQYFKILGNNLVGIYVHGSIAFDCFNPACSDIDFLVVVCDEPTLDEKIALIRVLHELDADAPQKGFEMSVVLLEDCQKFRHPTPFSLHFSNAHKTRAFTDPAEYCRTMNGVDPDLAAHFTVIRAVGIVLYGAPIEDVFAPVPKQAYIDSIYGDVCDAETDIYDNSVYIILNLCRVLAYLRDEAVLSKAQGGEWGIQNLPNEWHGLLHAATESYTGSTAFTTTENLGQFAKFMLNLINQQIKAPEV